jgi:hypothetical protein
MTKRDGLLLSEPAHTRLPPTEMPLRPLCPACGAERLSLRTQLHVTFEVVATAGLADELQVLDHRLEGCGWDDDDIACCERCNWRGRAAELR